MSVEDQLSIASPGCDTYLSIGVFDGVHAGHRYLLDQLVLKAREASLRSLVVTFTPHPQAVLHPDSNVQMLTSLEDRVAEIHRQGVDQVVVLTFTRRLAALTARAFVTLLQKHLKMQGLLVGANFTLGKGREGDLAALRRLGQELGFATETVPLLSPDGVVVSSSTIRHALAQGDVAKAERLLCRPFSLSGSVFAAYGRGRQLGFPTANIETQPWQALPKTGVYATITALKSQQFASVTNVGTRPTFEDGATTVETHLLGYAGSLYGTTVTVRFVQRLRDERRFASVEALKAQMTRDVERTRLLLQHND